MTLPSNHRQAERILIQLVRDGQWQIDENGYIWRTCVRHGLRIGGFELLPCTVRRVERKSPLGYLTVRAMIDWKRTTGFAHRLVWQHFFGDIPDGLTINHKNGIKDDTI